MQDTGPGNGKNARWYEAGMPGVLAQLLPLGRLPRSLAREICQAWVSGSTAAAWSIAWVSGSTALEKVPAFFEFAGTFFCAKPIETHRDSFYLIIWLDAGTFFNRISYRPANKLTGTDPRTSLLTLPREGDVPLAVGHHKIILYQSFHISHIQWILLRLKS